MKKILRGMLLAAVAVMAVTSLQSCKDDEDNPKNGLSGWYTTDEADFEGWFGEHIIYAYNFTNSNTVLYYGALTDKETVNSTSSVTVSGKRWWVDVGYPKSYTYTREDNKIIIPMQGVILTINGKDLSKDGSSDVYRKR